MTFAILDLDEFLADGLFSEDSFLGKAGRFDWERFRDANVLVRGCQSTIVPPWSYMIVTAQLVPLARSIRFGNEHDHIVVFRSPEISRAK